MLITKDYKMWKFLLIILTIAAFSIVSVILFLLGATLITWQWWVVMACLSIVYNVGRREGKGG
jgi:hypothetical protein